MQATEMTVRTQSGELLVETANQLPMVTAELVEPTGADGTCKIRVFTGADFLRFAMRQQGYGELIAEDVPAASPAARRRVTMDRIDAVARTRQVVKDKRLTGSALAADAIEMVLNELAAAQARIAELEGVERATEILVDTMDGIHSNPWDDPNFRVAINEASAALNRE